MTIVGHYECGERSRAPDRSPSGGADPDAVPGTDSSPDRVVVTIGALGVVGVVLWAAFGQDTFESPSDAALSWVLDNFAWLFVIAADVFLVLCLMIAFSRYGRIPRRGAGPREPAREPGAVPSAVPHRSDRRRGFTGTSDHATPSCVPYRPGNCPAAAWAAGPPSAPPCCGSAGTPPLKSQFPAACSERQAARLFAGAPRFTEILDGGAPLLDGAWSGPVRRMSTAVVVVEGGGDALGEGAA
ncbi:BCCT family transporter [Streptomyces cyaneofuscatus]|uniref:BCCT family transporter n=1 Tax=Streptomyces cyaneofuscatus TaxID=66883 RepID=UPI003666EF59